MGDDRHAIGDGNRDANGVWQGDQAQALLQFSKDNGIPLGAVEFTNEPSLLLGFPPGYNADDYARDFATFTDVVNRTFDLFVHLGATDEQLDFPIVYANARAGVAKAKAARRSVRSFMSLASIVADPLPMGERWRSSFIQTSTRTPAQSVRRSRNPP